MSSLHHIHSEADAALAFVRQHAGEHLEQDQNLLLERTASMLQERYVIRRQRALDTAAVALSAHAYASAEQQPGFGGWYIDQSRSNSFCVFIRSTKGHPTRVLTLVDLIRAADSLAQAKAC